MICIDCVKNQTLKNLIESSGRNAECSHCMNHALAVDDDQLAEYMGARARAAIVNVKDLSDFEFSMVFDCGSDEPHVFPFWEFFEDYDSFATDSFMKRFVDKLPDETDEHGAMILYALNDGHLERLNYFERKWSEIIRSVTHQYRFFNQKAKLFFDELFDALEVSGQLNEQAIYQVCLEKPIYRARIAYHHNDIDTIKNEPIKQLGPVPEALASSQRMTSAGVSSFYGAFDREVCVSELRPIVGDVVISARFYPNREFQLLDLDSLGGLEIAVDVLSDEFVKKSHAVAFFNELIFQLSRPSRRDGQHDYLPTQVVFEYLRIRFGGQVSGIKYSSVQKNGTSECIALFPEYSGVNRGVNSLDSTDEQTSLNKAGESLFLVTDSLKFHKIKSVSYSADVEESEHTLMMNDETLRRLYPSQRR